MKIPNYRVEVYYWNPNGTNDITIYNSRGEELGSIEGALFGYNTGSDESVIISLKEALRRVAVSPMGSAIDDILELIK